MICFTEEFLCRIGAPVNGPCKAAALKFGRFLHPGSITWDLAQVNTRIAPFLHSSLRSYVKKSLRLRLSVGEWRPVLRVGGKPTPIPGKITPN